MSDKKKPTQIWIQVGHKKYLVTPDPEEETTKTIKRIQKRINKTYDPRKQKRIRALAGITTRKTCLTAA
jgi:two-component SAPR family response regulator